MESLLAAQHITKTYEMGEVSVHALNDVSLELYKGEFIVLLGASGSGKSTLLNILGGLDQPTSGAVNYGNMNLAQSPSPALTEFRRQHVGFVFQFYNLIPRLTAQENIELITEISPDAMDPIEALGLVDLIPRKDHFPSQLSGGEQQRVAIARAIAKKPEILLCDEPTGALDVKTGVLVLKAIAKVNEELGTTTAIITHNSSIANMAHRVIHLKDGRIDKIIKNEKQIPPEEIQW